MQRVTITLDDALMEELDAIIAARGYQNRSEAIRDLARAGMREAAGDVGQTRECVAALVYTYDHAARQLSKRLTTAYHEHHELSLASLHVHLDHDTCLEVTVLQGATRRRAAIRRARHRRARGAHGKMVRMPVELATTPHRDSHSHDGGSSPSSPRRGGKETGTAPEARAASAALDGYRFCGAVA